MNLFGLTTLESVNMKKLGRKMPVSAFDSQLFVTPTPIISVLY